MGFETDMNGFTYYIDDGTGTIITPVTEVVGPLSDVPPQPPSGPTGIFTPSGGLIPFEAAPLGVDIVSTPKGPAVTPRQPGTLVPTNQVGGNYGIYQDGKFVPQMPANPPPLQMGGLPDLSKLFGGGLQLTPGDQPGKIDPMMLVMLMSMQGGGNNSDMLMMMIAMGAFKGVSLGVNSATGTVDAVTHPAPWDAPSMRNIPTDRPALPWEIIGGVFGSIKDWIGGVRTPISSPTGEFIKTVYY